MKNSYHKIKPYIKIKLQRLYFSWKHRKLLSFLATQSKLSRRSIHGISHWSRVEKNGAYLCPNTGADYEAVFLFAYLHDIARISEGDDLQHGQRAAVLIEKLYRDNQVKISQSQFELLTFACRHHNNSNIKSDNITIQTCWDADRLDLWRVGAIPDPALLNTEFAKRDEVINHLR